MSRADILNGGAFCRTERVLGNNTTADSEVNGNWVDRKDPNGKGRAQSGKLVINYSAVLADGETLSLAANFQDASSLAGAGADDYGDALPSTVIAAANSGGQTINDTVEVDVDLSGADEFIRGQWTLGTSLSGTVAFSAVFVLFGDREQPATKAVATL